MAKRVFTDESLTTLVDETKAYVNNAVSTKADVSHSHTELTYLDGVTSNVQTQLDGKSASMHTHSAATTTAAGMMSASDKSKLDGIEEGATAYTHPTYTARTGVPTANATPAFGGTFSVSQPVSDSTGHITAVNSRTITIPSTAASTSAAGLMSAADKTKLNNITESADSVSFTRSLTSGTKIGTITINGTGTDLYCNNDTNTDTQVTNTLDTSNLKKFYLTGTQNSTTSTGEHIFNEKIYATGSEVTVGSLVSTGSISMGRASDTTVGTSSTTLGTNCTASANATLASGNNCVASNNYATSFGNGNTASGSNSFSTGSGCTSSQSTAFTCNDANTAAGAYSFAGGKSCNASDTGAFVHGYNATANKYQAVFGHYNTTTNTGGNTSGTSGSALVIGCGTSSTAANAFRVTYAGQVYGKSTYNTSGADYAEFFEWADGNTNNEDRRGYFVTLDGDKIKVSEKGDYILGIVSGLPSVIGNSDEEWMGRYIMDEFGAFIVEDFEYDEEVTEDVTNEETGEVETVTKTVKKIGQKYKENPDYDPTLPYVHRQDRPEWSAVGMVGVLSVRDDGTCQVNGYCELTDGGIATASNIGYRVIKRINDNVVKVIFR